MSLQNNFAQFRAVGTLPTSGFVSEDTLGLEVSCHVIFAIAKETACSWGMTYRAIYTMDIIENRTKETLKNYL